MPHGTKTIFNALLICFATEIPNNLSQTRKCFALNVGARLVKSFSLSCETYKVYNGVDLLRNSRQQFPCSVVGFSNVN